MCKTISCGTRRGGCNFREFPPQVAFLNITTTLLNYANATESIKGKAGMSNCVALLVYILDTSNRSAVMLLRLFAVAVTLC